MIEEEKRERLFKQGDSPQRESVTFRQAQEDKKLLSELKLSKTKLIDKTARLPVSPNDSMAQLMTRQPATV